MFYFIVVNIFLNTVIAPWLINQKPEKLAIRWDSAWMLWPGVIHVRGLEIRVQSRRLQWWLKFDKVNMGLNLYRLKDRHFQTEWVKGQGLVFRLRPRLTQPDVDRLRFMPSIPGLSNPPDPVPEILYPRRTLKPPWLIELNGFDVSRVKQIWIDHYRFSGDGHISGQMTLKVRGPLAIKRASLIFDADIFVGEAIFAKKVNMDVKLSVERYVPRIDMGIAAFRYLSGRYQVRAEVEDMHALEQTFNKTEWFRLAGKGKLKADLRLTRGYLTPGSGIQIDSSKIHIRFIDHMATGTGQVRLNVRQDGPKASGHLSVNLNSFKIMRPPRIRPHIRGRDFRITAITHDLDLTHAPYTAMDITLDIPESEVTDLSFYNRYIPAGTGFVIESGQGVVRTHLEANGKDHVTNGFIDVRIKNMVSRFEGTEMKGDLMLHTKLSKGNVKTREFNFSGTHLALTNAHVIGNRTSSKDNWWGNVVVTRGMMTFTNPLKVRAVLAMKMRDTGPVIAIFVEKKSIPKLFKKMLTVRNIQARANLVVQKNKLEISDIIMSGRKLAILAELRLAKGRHSGIFYTKFYALSMALELKQGKKTWTMIRPRKWFNDRKRRYSRPGTK